MQEHVGSLLAGVVREQWECPVHLPGTRKLHAIAMSALHSLAIDSLGFICLRIG